MNSVVQLISGDKKFEHITPTLKNLHWLPVDKRILFKLSCMTYKALNGQAALPDQPAEGLYSIMIVKVHWQGTTLCPHEDI